MEAHANVQNLPLMEAKMAYIKAWQSLPDYGISYFIVKQKNAKKEVKCSSYIKIHLQYKCTLSNFVPLPVFFIDADENPYNCTIAVFFFRLPYLLCFCYLTPYM